MSFTKTKKIFFGLLLLLSACEKKEEEIVDIDQMVMVEMEDAKHIASDPEQSPQETLIQEPMSIE